MMAHRRYCLICCWPAPHVEAATHNGYIPHPYDSGERRHGEEPDHSRALTEKRELVAA